LTGPAPRDDNASMRPSLLAVIFAAAAFAQRAPGPLPPVSEYRAGRTLDPIAVDGRLDEFTWAALPRMGRFINIQGGEEALTQATMAWDDDYLYAAFACADAAGWGTLMERDAELWNEEVVEVFLDPDGDGKNYAELEVSPHNVVVDLLIPAPGGLSAGDAKQWNIEGLRTAVAKSAAGWTVEIAIPWKSLAAAGVSDKPSIGARWRVGMYRIERPTPRQRTGADQLLAWSQTTRNFHEPQRFGWVEFVLKP
jgi:hypothetical protein